jgi:hypothetical protein
MRAQSVWRYAPDSVLLARTQDASRFGGDKKRSYQWGYAAPATTTGRRNVLAGNAITSLNAPIPYARIVLRNVQTGEVLARAMSNAEGEFSFLDLDPNVYILELIGADGAVLGTSTVVGGMIRGEMRNVQVRVASAAAAVRSAVGNTLAGTSPQATTLAAANGVTRTTTTQATAVSPGASTGSAR